MDESTHKYAQPHLTSAIPRYNIVQINNTRVLQLIQDGEGEDFSQMERAEERE